MDEIAKSHGKIDGLANCAGVFAGGKPFYQLDLEDWNRVLSINITGAFLLSKHCAKRMIKQGFVRIVNISCVRSRVFSTDMADYAASKGAVTALTSAMALDLQAHNIRVNGGLPISK